MESVYALMFFLGSITRHRPTDLLDALEGRYGAFIREFLATQPRQFVFEIACEFRKQEVSQAAVV
ncbi:MAG: hypothetical protein H0U53_02915 [Actinobacteria bacterium]|nr:hypothetical protein [Actinomycetota bacterium]